MIVAKAPALVATLLLLGALIVIDRLNASMPMHDSWKALFPSITLHTKSGLSSRKTTIRQALVEAMVLQTPPLGGNRHLGPIHPNPGGFKFKASHRHRSFSAILSTPMTLTTVLEVLRSSARPKTFRTICRTFS